jgi:hypothetical protein
MPGETLGVTLAAEAIVEFVIQEVTLGGRAFRPSDRTELAKVQRAGAKIRPSP